MEWKHKVGKDVLGWMESRSSSRLSVIVQHNSSEKLSEVTRNLKIKKSLPFMSAFLAELSRDEISFLARQSCIVYISSNRSIASCLDIARPAIGADKAQDSGLTGQRRGLR